MTLVLVASFSLVTAGPVHAATINVPGDHATIQGAIDAAVPGDTIIVAAGTYPEDVTIPPALTDLTLLGANAGKSAHPDNPDGRGPESIIEGTVRIGISHGSAEVTIDGFRIDSGASSGVVIRGTGITITNTIILGLDPYPTSGAAGGLRFERGGVNPGDPASFIFANNWVDGYRYGVFVDGPAADFDASGTPSLIVGNYLNNNERGIQTMGSMHGATIIHEISGNTIVENGRGIRLAGGGFAVERNIIKDNEDYGVQAGAADVPMDDLTIRHNCISGNGPAEDPMGVDNASGLEVSIDAILNWWGHASGPYHDPDNTAGTGDPVSDDVDFAPWLTGLAYTGEISFSETDDVVLQATFDSSDNGAEGATVDFYVDGEHVGDAVTGANGVAGLNMGPLAAGVYDVVVKAAGCMKDTAEIEVLPPIAGGEASPVSKLPILAPWLAMIALIGVAAAVALRRSRAHS